MQFNKYFCEKATYLSTDLDQTNRATLEGTNNRLSDLQPFSKL